MNDDKRYLLMELTLQIKYLMRAIDSQEQWFEKEKNAHDDLIKTMKNSVKELNNVLTDMEDLFNKE
tara:strand:+ start:5837 stop:6034 length:198 start_codon:yes stop_codon:yes gene_type:complete